jgi:hypothetical protein
MTSAWQVKKVGNVTARIRTANIRTIYRNGRPIEVGTIEIEGLSPLRRKRAKDTFLLLTKTDAVAGFKANAVSYGVGLVRDPVPRVGDQQQCGETTNRAAAELGCESVDLESGGVSP